jgi:hypothetical protein
MRMYPREQVALFRAVLPVAFASMGATWLMQGPFVLFKDKAAVASDLGAVALVLQVFILLTGLPVALGRAVLPALSRTVARTDNKESVLLSLVLRTSIPVEKIGALIGPGGRTIRGIQEHTGAKIDVEEDGTVFVSSTDAAGAQKALTMVERLTKDVEIGGVYLGRVSRITNFGAFVEILPGKEGLVRLG